MSKKLKFFYPEEGLVFCTARDKEYYGEGFAIFNRDGIEETPNKLVGETIAYSKAMRSIVKQKLTDKKTQLKHLVDFHTYIFPPKCQEGASWIMPRSEKRIAEIKQEIVELENQIKEINETIEDYLKQRENFLKRLKKKRNDNSK